MLTGHGKWRRKDHGRGNSTGVLYAGVLQLSGVLQKMARALRRTGAAKIRKIKISHNQVNILVSRAF